MRSSALRECFGDEVSRWYVVDVSAPGSSPIVEVGGRFFAVKAMQRATPEQAGEGWPLLWYTVRGEIKR